MSLSVVPKYPFPEKMVKDNAKNSAIRFEKKRSVTPESYKINHDIDIEQKLSLFYL